MNNIATPLLLSFLAGISTVIGSLFLFSFKKFNDKHLSFFLGVSAGSMVYLSFMELMPEAISNIGFAYSNITFFLGILFMSLFDIFVPHHIMSFCNRKGIKFDKLMVSGIMVAIAITIHNFPEGIAVFMSSLGDIRLGLLIAFATAIHNIPEGLAVAAPIYYSSKSKLKAVGFSFLAGIAEPIGAILAYLILKPYLSVEFLNYIFAFVAGVMVYISFDELLPSCFEYKCGHTAIIGIISGMMLMALSLSFI
jgi:ZIP family zinc transporter